MLDIDKKSHTFFDGEVVLLRWEIDRGSLVVICFPALADGDSAVYGFGLTVNEAISSLDKAYKELVDFATHD